MPDGATYRCTCGYQDVRCNSLCNCASWRPLETTTECDDLCPFEEQPDVQDYIGVDETELHKNGRSSQGRIQRKEDYIAYMFLRFMCTPFTKCLGSPLWNKNAKTKWITKKDKAIQAVQDVIYKEWAYLSVEQIMDIYNMLPGKGPRWNAGLRCPIQFFLNINTSIKVIKYILKKQTGHVKHSVQAIYDLLNKVKPKRNTLMIVGAPNAGKTYLVESLAQFCHNTGYLANFNRTTAFPLNDCVDRRLIIWNEPNFEESAAETLKMILGGDKLAANKKWEDHAHIDRTPVIITTNAQIFNMSNPVWSSRILVWNWQSLPALKYYTKPIHPAVWINIFEEYIHLNNSSLPENSLINDIISLLY
nr:nonstructural protein [Red mite densovirus 1]